MSKTESPVSTATAKNLPANYQYRWLILAVMLTAEIMDLLDSTIVNVGGPTLKQALNANATSLQWIIGGYTLSLGSGLVLGGRLGDRYGRRNMFLFGLIGFTVASLACAMAPTTEVLIAFRLMQGFLGAMLLPQGFGMLREVFLPQDLAKAFGVFGPVFGVAGVLGPIIGGFIIQGNVADLGWRSVFLVNLPFGVAATLIAWRVVPRSAGDRKIKIDLLGALLIIASSAALIYPLIKGQDAGWPAWCWFMIAGSFVGFGLFALQERRTHAAGKTSLINPSILRKPAFSFGVASLGIFFASLTGFALTITLFLQLGHAFSAGDAGLANIPIAIGSFIGAGLSGAVLAEKLGRKVLQIGATVQILGAAWLWFALGANGAFSIWNIVPGMVIVGLGGGLIIAALFDLVLSAASQDELGSASGLQGAVQSVFSSLGVAIFGTVFFAQVNVGNITQGMQNALLVQAGFMAVFLLLSPALPHKVSQAEY